MVEELLSIPLPPQSPESDDGHASGRAPIGLGEFWIGPENRLVEVVFHSVLHTQPDNYNPIVLYGPSGVGKSHLARGLAEAWKSHFRRSVVYATALDFARQLTDAMETHAIEEFRARYRSALLLVIDEIAHWAGKAAAQEEFLHTLDASGEAGQRVLVTAAAAPAELPGLLPGLRSRLGAGLVVPLLPPAPATRLAIVRRLAAGCGLELAEPALREIAEGVRGTVSDLAGTIAQLQLLAQLEEGPIDLQHVRDYLAEREGAGLPRVSDIAAATARHFGLRLALLRSASRRQAVVQARGVAMYLARELTRDSLQQIGRYFGGRDHTTVLHACRKTGSLLATEPAISRAAAQLRQLIERGSWKT